MGLLKNDILIQNLHVFMIYYEAKIRWYNNLFIKAYSTIENIDINPILTYTVVFKKHMKKQTERRRHQDVE